ncbi:MAG: helix-turn-helix domain-containing protein, partial [Fimbriimonadales bacterium]|nr:helix-turn-helix domain-containing protein [Fimbriimonadales bacterium]
NEVELNYLPSGRLLVLIGGRRVVVEAQRLTAFWACVPHQVVGFEGLTEYFVVTIPLAWFLQWRLPDALTQAVLAGRAVAEHPGASADHDRMRFEQWVEDLEQGTPDRVQACSLEVHARLLRLSRRIGGDAEPAARRSWSCVPHEDLGCAERMAAFIALHYTEPLSTTTVAAHVRLHPNYAMTLFRRTFGTTILSWIHQHRLSHAQRLLATTSKPVGEIALESGFGSLSRFHEAFRREYGCTPLQFRRRVLHPG